MNQRTLTTSVLVLVAIMLGFGLGWYAHDLSNGRRTLEQRSLLVLKHGVRNGMSLSDVSRVVGETCSNARTQYRNRSLST